LTCIPLYVSEILVSVGTTILSEATRDASFAAPCVWQLPDLWTQRTRPQVFAKPQTVSHSSHTPHRLVPFRRTKKTGTLRILGHRPTDSAEEAEFEGFRKARNIFDHAYDIDDFEQDLETLKRLEASGHTRRS